ncbi:MULTISPECIES: hypothetical protein [Leptospira]|uniref:hypothetical protein n=1 Tax=Leptospira TaxID=171 RepID=UPI0002BE288F|nr:MULTISPECIES: hypothetical protein [Leptospira]EMK11419.1 leucine rich repeat protein [Leptospira sp. serovar Kenya str. Sh9]
METIPVEIVDLKKLIRIDLSKNRISNLPDLKAELESVKELSLGENRISKLPKSLVQFSNLESLGLGGEISSKNYPIYSETLKNWNI